MNRVPEDPGQRTVLLGRVIGVHGIRGEIKVSCDSGEPENFKRYRRILLFDGSRYREYALRHTRVHGKSALLALEGICGRSAAEGVVGQQVHLFREDLPEPGEGELYLHDLLGRQVVTAEGQLLGRVGGFVTGAGQDLLVVSGKREHLIPLVGAFLVAIEDGKLVMNLPPGLVELD